MKAAIWNKSWWVKETLPDTLKNKLELMLQVAGFTIVGFAGYTFSPAVPCALSEEHGHALECGFSAVWLLAESHLAMHTFPEEGKSYLELSSCNEAMFLEFQKVLARQFVTI